MRGDISVRQNLLEKLLAALSVGIAEEFRWWRSLDDFTLIHEDHSVGYPLGETHFMGDDHHGHSVPCQGLHHVENFVDHLRIER
jgi:hypothetical protein